MMLSRGFTLIELMITIAIAAILLSVAVPNYQSFVTNTRLTTQANELMTDIALARSEAVKRNQRVTICISSDNQTCTGGTAWGVGRIVFVDFGTVGSFAAGDGDTILKVSQALTAGFTLTSANFTNSAHFQFNGRGSAPDDGALTLCKSGVVGRVISITATGRASVAPTASACA